MTLLPQLHHLLLTQPGKGKHANLIRDMVPRSRRAHLLQFLAKRFTHRDDSAGHLPEIVFPLGKEFGVVEDGGGDACAVGGWVGDLGALQDGELRGDAADGLLGVGAWSGDEVEGASAFAVETKVLCEGLRDDEFEALLDKVADGPGVFGEVARGETLVGAVKEREV